MSSDAAVPDAPSNEPGLITAADAAARLGVKRQTLYAYVSRGLLHRTVAIDGRSSLFDASEIDAFRLGKADKTEGELRTVITTSITHVNDDALLIRGRDLIKLVADQHTFLEIVDLLWQSPDDEPWPSPDPTISTELGGIDGLRSALAGAASPARTHRRCAGAWARSTPGRRTGSQRAALPRSRWER